MTISPAIRDLILVASKSADEAKDYSPTPVDEILISFFKSETKPDVKKLLRKGDPLPEGAGWLLAEILDSRPPHRLACNWQLKPVHIGRYDEELLLDKIDAAVPRIRGALAARINGLARNAGVCVRIFHRVLARREELKQFNDRVERIMQSAHEIARRKLDELTARKRQ